MNNIQGQPHEPIMPGPCAKPVSEFETVMVQFKLDGFVCTEDSEFCAVDGIRQRLERSCSNLGRLYIK